jgi:hypothetical protein
MAIAVKVLHDEKLVLMTVNPTTRRGDYMKMLAEITAAKAVGYRKIFDSRYTPPDYKVSDFRSYAQTIGDWGKTEKPGPTAMIVSSEVVREFAELYRDHVQLDRPLRIFTDMESARAWLDEVAPVA